MNVTRNIPSELLQYATAAFNKAVAAKETSAKNVDQYLDSLQTPMVQAYLDEITVSMLGSWKPADSPEVLAKREELMKSLENVSHEKLTEIDAIIKA